MSYYSLARLAAACSLSLFCRRFAFALASASCAAARRIPAPAAVAPPPVAPPLVAPPPAHSRAVCTASHCRPCAPPSAARTQPRRRPPPAHNRRPPPAHTSRYHPHAPAPHCDVRTPCIALAQPRRHHCRLVPPAHNRNRALLLFVIDMGREKRKGKEIVVEEPARKRTRAAREAERAEMVAKAAEEQASGRARPFAIRDTPARGRGRGRGMGRVRGARATRATTAAAAESDQSPSAAETDSDTAGEQSE
jgi:hypothetical protein